MTQPPIPPASGAPWSNQHPPPPPQSNASRSRWIILGVSLIVVVALVVGIIVWKRNLVGDSEDSSNFASGDGDKTIGLLREKDPVCDDWLNYADELAAQTKDWSEIDKAIPATAWTPHQQAIVDNAVDTISTAADRFESILPKAQNVILRELIAQTIVYWRTYLDRVADYVEADRLISGVAGNFGNAVTYMCSAVPVVVAKIEENDPRLSSAKNSGNLVSFMGERDSSCGELKELTDERNVLLSGWFGTDSEIPATEWTTEQRELSNAVREVLINLAKKVLRIAQEGSNPIFSDLLVTYSEYLDAFGRAITDYSPDDSQLWKVSTSISGGLNAACEASR